MGVLRYKVIRDLWDNKGRTLQVVLIIGIGAFAIGAIIGTRNLMIPGMEQMWQGIDPPSIFLFTGPPVTEDEIEVLKREEGVQEIEGSNNATIEWRLDPSEEWRQGNLTARADYETQKLNRVELIEGEWPSDEVVLIGQDTEQYFGVPQNGKVYLRVDDKDFLVTTSGSIYNMFQQPAYFGGSAQFYVDIDYFEKLVGTRNFNQLYVRTTVQDWDEEATADIADTLQDKIEQMGKDSGRFVSDPGKHFFQDQMDGIFFLLGVLGVLALILGLLLVYNTINAVISQQVEQIGVMKAVGASTWQILRLYLVLVMAYGIMAAMLAVPAGIAAGWFINKMLIESFGASAGEFQVSWLSVGIMVVIALVAPLLASFFPIIGGARITVREAISTYGLSTKPGIIEKILSRARRVSRLIIITISNTFRHKRRVLLLEIALIISGLMFMMVISVRDSVIYTINDVLFEILDADVTLLFEKSERIHYIEELTLNHPEVSNVELWGLTGATIRPADQESSEDDEQSTLFGVPLPTKLYGHQLRKGRWLVPEDEYGIVMNTDLADTLEVSVGDWVTIEYTENSERDWRVVGLVFDPMITNSVHVSREVMLRDIGHVDKAEAVWIQLKSTDQQAHIQIAKDLRQYYEDHNVGISPQRGVFGLGGDSTVETASTLVSQFNFLVALLAIMAVIIGAVGSIALSGALSLSVLERRREIGVMRAIGASSWTIFRMFIGEGILLGWLSWLIALPLSLPAGKLMVLAIGEAFQIEMVYHYTLTGAIMWFFIITVLSILASWLPARGATKISVQESLAYQ